MRICMYIYSYINGFTCHIGCVEILAEVVLAKLPHNFFHLPPSLQMGGRGHACIPTRTHMGSVLGETSLHARGYPPHDKHVSSFQQLLLSNKNKGRYHMSCMSIHDVSVWSVVVCFVGVVLVCVRLVHNRSKSTFPSLAKLRDVYNMMDCIRRRYTL